MFQTLKRILYFIPFFIINMNCLTTIKRADWHNASISGNTMILPFQQQLGFGITGETGILDIQKKGGIKMGATIQILSQENNQNNYMFNFYFFDHISFSVIATRFTYLGISVDMALLQPFRTEFIFERQFYNSSFLFTLSSGYYGDMRNLERYGEAGVSVIWGEPVNLFVKLFSRTYPEKDDNDDKWILGLHGGFGWIKRLRL